MGTRALIYTRVSQDRAGGRSPAEQELEARQECERQGWDVVDVVTDSVGASRHSKGHRTGWDRAREMVKSGAVDVLVTWEASRAQRDLDAYVQLRQLCAAGGVLWSYSGRTYDLADHDDRFRTGLDALLAEREADEIAHRVQRAMRANAAQGRPHGRRLFGYRRVYDDATGALIGQAEHPDEAPVVRRIFDDYLSGLGIRTIARDLNEDGITTGTGARWLDAQVRRVLINPAYIARRVHRGDVVADGDWPPLVDVDQFDRVQARLASKAANRSRQRGTARLLTGLGRCGVCGGRVHALHDRRGRKFYECGAQFCVARDLAKLDAYVTAVVLERLSLPDVAEALGDAGPSPEVERARQEGAQLRQRLDDVIDQFAAGNLTAATLAKVEGDLLPRIAAADAAVRRGAIPLAIDVPDGTQVDAWWDGLEPEQRREVVGALLAAVVILPVGRGHRTFNPSGVRIEWR